jgi:hypothetical protein
MVVRSRRAKRLMPCIFRVHGQQPWIATAAMFAAALALVFTWGKG